MCRLEFYSNKGKKYGPYGSASPFSPHGSRRYYEGKRITIVFLKRFFECFRNFFPNFCCYPLIVNLPCDWSKAIKMDKFPVGFSGASVSFSYIRNKTILLNSIIYFLNKF